MMSMLLPLLLLLSLLSSACQAQSTPQSSVLVEAYGPCLLATDAADNLYASACVDNTLLKVTASGTVSVLLEVPAIEEPDGVAVIGSSLYALVPTGLTEAVTSGYLAVLSTVDGSLQAQYPLPELQYAFRLAAAADGQSLWVLDNSALPLWQLGLDGSVLTHVNTSAVFSNDFGNAEAVAVDASGNVYVAAFSLTPSFQFGASSVYKFSANGVFEQNLTINSEPFLPGSLVIDSSGDLYMANEFITAVVKVDGVTGNVVLTFNTSAYYEELYGVAIDSTGSYLLVADLYNARIDRFSLQTGQLVNVLPTSQSTIYQPDSLALLGVNLLVTSPAMGFIAVIAPNGTQVDNLYISSSPDHDPTSLAVDAQGFIYVGDGAFSAVFKLSSSGQIVQTFNTSNPSLAVYEQSGLLVLASGGLLATDAGNNRIVHFAPDGSVLGFITHNYSSSGSPFSPNDIALLGTDQLLVVDRTAGELLIFALDGSFVSNFSVGGSPVAACVSSPATGSLIFVVGQSTGLIAVYTASGQLLRSFNTSNPDTALVAASGCALSDSGELYVSPEDSQRVVVFSNVLSSPSVKGDPSFVGLLGQRYEVHGIDGETYALISAPQLQLNARFTFLASGSCPVLDGVPDSNCWSHPGSYLGAVGLQYREADGRLRQLSVTAGSRLQGFADVTLDGQSLAVGDGMELSEPTALSVRWLSSHRLTVRTAELELQFSNSDGFINQQVATLVPLSRLQQQGWHGLLGQTHSRARYASAIQHIAGQVDDYIVPDRQLFGTSALFNRFTAEV